MEMIGERTIPASEAEVWRSLNDPEVLKACIAGCESIEAVSATEFHVALTAAVGPVKAKFKGKLFLSEINALTSYALNFEGTGGVAGFGKGNARVVLAANAERETTLRYTVQANVGGKLAQIGSRLIDSASKKMADDFFARFALYLSQGSPALSTNP